MTILSDTSKLKTTYAKALRQDDIDDMNISESERATLKPGWYWISSWPAFERGSVLVIFTPFANPESDLAVFFKIKEAL